MFKILKNDICNTEFKVIRPFACYDGGIYPKHEGIYVAPICSNVNQQHDHQLTRYKPKTLSSQMKNLDIWFYLGS